MPCGPTRSDNKIVHIFLLIPTEVVISDALYMQLTNVVMLFIYVKDSHFGLPTNSLTPSQPYIVVLQLHP